MRGIDRRLDRLVPILRPVGCRTCGWWTGCVLVGNDGPLRPERCPDCGRTVPITAPVRIGIELALL